MTKTYTVGRDPACDIVIADASVAPVHAVVEPLEGRGFRMMELHGAVRVDRPGGFSATSDHLVHAEDTVYFGTLPFPASDLPGAIAVKNGDFAFRWRPEIDGETAGGSRRRVLALVLAVLLVAVVCIYREYRSQHRGVQEMFRRMGVTGTGGER